MSLFVPTRLFAFGGEGFLRWLLQASRLSASFVRPLFFGGIMMSLSSAALHAQEGVGMRNVLEKIGVLPNPSDDIEYRERPSLVVPKDLNTLRKPENQKGEAKNKQWPSDPDVAAKAKEKERRAQSLLFPQKNDASEGGRLSLEEIAQGRLRKGETTGEAPIPSGNDKVGVRLGIEEMSKVAGTEPSYPPGKEPPRRYLTDPPTGLRKPSTAAPIGKRTNDGPEVIDNGKVRDAWKQAE